ncbi:tRNA 2-thiouridine(34) synthase MnmA [Candidatus Saccharibacteria bacterium]|nr:tRNA 2-thiouridine(34) synthase MnmA [Candidatus Saccharibacteria bacterium]
MSRVFVGLSGGVDSSVAAALLKDQGHEVIGVYMKNWSHDVAGHHCPWREDLASARSVAAHLQIPLKVYDFEREYFDTVAKYMIDTYKAGLTPNPDIMCNSEIKFKLFLSKCRADGAEMIATGHYAKIIDGQLCKAKDASKDQTYFLYRMPGSAAKKTIFPLGELAKTQVRILARKYKLPTANRADSQGLCFVGPVPMRDFLAEFVRPKPGDIVSERGNKIGQHQGAFYYTIGQRHGLGVGGGQPYFVYKVDTKANVVHVTTDEDSTLLKRNNFKINDCVWWQEPETGKEYTVKVRYRVKAIACTITPRFPVTSTGVEKSSQISRQARDDTWTVKLTKPERAIAPGQSAVLYDGNKVAGGGIIEPF